MKKTIWVNGCFDVLHRGHFELFKFCKAIGNWLVVGIDSDVKVRHDKGPTRPVNTEEDRKFVLERLQDVDEVVVFNTTSELEACVKNLSPDFMIVGSDWKDKKIVGSEHAKNLLFFDRLGDYSTTSILNVRRSEKNETK